MAGNRFENGFWRSSTMLSILVLICKCDSDEVFGAMMASGRSAASSLAASSRFTSSFPAMASTTMSRPARSSGAPQGFTRASVASASAALILPFSASLLSASCM